MILIEATDQLRERLGRLARRTAEDLLAHVLGIAREELYLSPEKSLSDEAVKRFRSLTARVAEGEPLAHILREVPFFSCDIAVDDSVLIPRAETELLAEKVATKLKKQDLGKKQLWDLCSGSGCLGISLKKRFPELEVTLVDISSKAVEMSERNAKKNEVDVRCLIGDLLDPLKGEKAHFVVCNPPYISMEDYRELDIGVKDYEPKEALLGGETGLVMYERLSRELPGYLYPGAQVFFEIGEEQGEKMFSLFSSPQWKSGEIKRDYTGRERFFFLENELLS